MNGSADAYAASVMAAKPFIGKAVFCIDNVARIASEDDVTRFVTKLGVTVLSCHRVQPRRSRWQREQKIVPDDRSAFRLCIPREESGKMLNADAWPEHVAITAWRFGKKKDADVVVIDDGARSRNVEQQRPPASHSTPVAAGGNSGSTSQLTAAAAVAAAAAAATAVKFVGAGVVAGTVAGSAAASTAAAISAENVEAMNDDNADESVDSQMNQTVTILDYDNGDKLSDY